MNRTLFFFLILAAVLFLQTDQAAAQELRGVMLSLTLDNMSGKSQDLTVGILEGATTGLDQSLGEAELPPLPPAEIFDARMTSTPGKSSLGTGSLADFRPANPATVSYTETYTIEYQGGLGATKAKLSWQSPLPGRVTKLLVDAVDMTSKADVEVSFPSGQIIVVVTYNYAPLSFTANPTSLSFDAGSRDSLPSKTLEIIPQGDVTAQWMLSTDADWIDPDMGNGEGRQTVTVAVNIGLVPTGTYTGTITVRSPLYPAQLDIPVTLHYTLGVNGPPLPEDMALLPSFPNPASEGTTIGVRLGSSADEVPVLLVTDMSGRTVLDLSPQLWKIPDLQHVTIDTRNLPAGTYAYTLRVAGYEVSHSLIVLK